MRPQRSEGNNVDHHERNLSIDSTPAYDTAMVTRFETMKTKYDGLALGVPSGCMFMRRGGGTAKAGGDKAWSA